VKAGNGQHQCLVLKAPVTGVLKSGGAPFNGGMKEEVTWCLFLFSGGGRGRREAGCRWWLARSTSVREEEEEGRLVPWQVPSLKENVFPEIRQGLMGRLGRLKGGGSPGRSGSVHWRRKREADGAGWAKRPNGSAGLIKGRKIKRVLIFEFK
jgi:hypothetical protein